MGGEIATYHLGCCRLTGCAPTATGERKPYHCVAQAAGLSAPEWHLKKAYFWDDLNSSDLAHRRSNANKHFMACHRKQPHVLGNLFDLHVKILLGKHARLQRRVESPAFFMFETLQCLIFRWQGALARARIWAHPNGAKMQLLCPWGEKQGTRERPTWHL